jgi:SAM-dependent methyltransferase
LEKDVNTYMIDTESGAEMARLIDQDRIVTRAMGGLLPPDFEPEEGKIILDLGCGPGGWAQEVAFQHPLLHIMGIDVSHKMIGYAQSFVSIQHLKNLTFQVMDLRALPLDLPDNTFDHINGRFMAGFLFKDDWPAVIQECLRLLRPGGMMRFTESDRCGRTTSRAFEELQNALLLDCFHTNRGFDKEDMGVAIRLPELLRGAQCEQVHVQSHIVDWSINSSAWTIVRQNFEISYALLRPHFSQSAYITIERWDKLWKQAQHDFYAADFGALWPFVSVWGRKPL